MAHLMEFLKLSLSARRAWIEIILFVNLRVLDGSLSARRAWIEICLPIELPRERGVALRKESVDRNRALGWKLMEYLIVALRKESVDRNFIELLHWGAGGGRSPQGERG